jgi:hypothetical protein
MAESMSSWSMLRFCMGSRPSPAEYKAGLDLAITQGLVGAGSVRHLREVHGNGCGVIRLMANHAEGYLPSVSSFFFSSWFILLTVGLWLLAPVV